MEGTINILVNGVCTSTVVIIGVILNCVAIHIVWKHYERTNIFYQMLIHLLCQDICVLVTWMNLSLFVAFGISNSVIIHMVPYFSYPSTHIAITASTFMTVAIAHERYLAVRYPMKYSEGMKSIKATTNRLRMYLAIVFCISVGINIPHFMDLEVTYVDISAYNANVTQFNATYSNLSDVTYGQELIAPLSNITDESAASIESSELDVNLTATLKYTKLGTHPYYLKWYRNFARLIVSGIVPFTLLIYFNTVIYLAVKKSTNRRRRLSSQTHLDVQRTISTDNSRTESVDTRISSVKISRRKSMFNKRKDEENLSMVFVVIVTAFLLCHCLKFILNFYEGFFGKVGATSGLRIAGCFSNFLVVLNSSINTVIYCIMNTKFRNHFINVIKRCMPCIEKLASTPSHINPNRQLLDKSNYAKDRDTALEMNNIAHACDTQL